jgi:heptosyltransferase-2
VHVRPGPWRERVVQLRALRQRLAAEDPGFERRSNTLLLPYAFSAALDARLAGLRAEGHATEARSWLMRRGLPRRAGRHSLVEYWELACDFLGVQAEPPTAIGMRVSPQQREQADALLASRGLTRGRFVLICPFANGSVEFLDPQLAGLPGVRAAPAGQRPRHRHRAASGLALAGHCGGGPATASASPR